MYDDDELSLDTLESIGSIAIHDLKSAMRCKKISHRSTLLDSDIMQMHSSIPQCHSPHFSPAGAAFA